MKKTQPFDSQGKTKRKRPRIAKKRKQQYVNIHGRRYLHTLYYFHITKTVRRYQVVERLHGNSI